MSKMHAGVLKILDLAIPMHTSTFLQDFPQLIFQQEPVPPWVKTWEMLYSVVENLISI